MSTDCYVDYWRYASEPERVAHPVDWFDDRLGHNGPINGMFGMFWDRLWSIHAHHDGRVTPAASADVQQLVAGFRAWWDPLWLLSDDNFERETHMCKPDKFTFDDVPDVAWIVESFDEFDGGRWRPRID